jgi:hypothetical protein
MDNETLHALHLFTHRIGTIEAGDVYMIGQLAEDVTLRKAFRKIAKFVHANVPELHCLCDAQ